MCIELVTCQKSKIIINIKAKFGVYLLQHFQVAIAGGDSQGMEVWNPRTGSVQQLEDPRERDHNYGLKYASMVSINDGKEILLYGGFLVKSQSALQIFFSAWNVQWYLDNRPTSYHIVYLHYLFNKNENVSENIFADN